MELMVPIDNQSRLPLYEQIYQYMKEEIQSGRIPAGSRLPSTRILAENLKVSRSTTQMAYEQLLSEGYIEALPCKGYFVCRIEELVRVEKNADEEFAENRSEKEMPYAVDFSTRGIDLDSFPFNTWRRLSRNTLVDDNKEMFAVGDPQGEYELRAAIRVGFMVLPGELLSRYRSQAGFYACTVSRIDQKVLYHFITGG